MNVFMKAYLPRILMSVVFAAVVWWTSRAGTDGQFPIYYYIILVVFFLFHQVLIPACTVNNNLYMCVCVCVWEYASTPILD